MEKQEKTGKPTGGNDYFQQLLDEITEKDMDRFEKKTKKFWRKIDKKEKKQGFCSLY